MTESIRSSVLPVIWLLMHAAAGAQVPGPDTKSAPTPQTEVFIEDARWVSAAHGAVPAGAIAHGRESDGRPQYICRARSGSGVHLGRISQGSSGCLVVSKGRPVTLSNYQVLTEIVAHDSHDARQPRESVVDLVRRRLAESDPANKKR